MNLYDYLGRSVDAVEVKFMSVDSLVEKYYSISPYECCARNPACFIDPFSIWKTTVAGCIINNPIDIKRFSSYLSVEKTVFNNNPTINQMGSFVKGEMPDVGVGKSSDGSKLAPVIFVNGYKSESRVQWFADSKSVDNAWLSIQRDLTPH